MVVLKLQLLFNDTSEKERKMANEVNAHSCKSGFVKDVLWAHMAEDRARNEPVRPGLQEYPDLNF